MPRYTIEGVTLDLPEDLLAPGLVTMLEKGWYEVEERKALAAHLTPRDRVLELGGGAGLLAALAVRGGADRVTTVEANPALLPVIRETLNANDAARAEVIHAAVTARGAPMGFAAPGAFWSGAVSAEGNEVPGLSFDALLAERQPSMLLVDVEGAEADFFTAPLPACLRLIVLEIHPEVYPRKTIPEIFARLAGQGFAYEPVGSHGTVICFARY